MSGISSIDLDLLGGDLCLLGGNIGSGSDKCVVFGVGGVSLSLESSKSIGDIGGIGITGVVVNTSLLGEIICRLGVGDGGFSGAISRGGKIKGLL